MREAAEDKKAEDLAVLDLIGRTIIADAFVVMTGRSAIQTRSIADAFTPDQRQFYNLERLWGRVAEARAEAR